MKPIVIDTPEVLSLRRKYLDALLTFVFWVIWIYLFTPLITLLGWVLGIHHVYFQMFELRGAITAIDNFGLFLKCLAAIGGSLSFWAYYNFRRFGNIDRRAQLPPVTSEQLSAFFHVEQSVLFNQQKSKCLSVSFDNAGNIIQSVELTSLMSYRINLVPTAANASNFTEPSQQK